MKSNTCSATAAVFFEIRFEEESQGEETDCLASRELHGHAPLGALGDCHCAEMGSAREERRTAAFLTAVRCTKVGHRREPCPRPPASLKQPGSRGDYFN